MLEQADQDDLNPAGVNCVRKFEKPAIELWGARTLSTDPARALRQRPPPADRRQEGDARTPEWTVFEPNGPTLWRRIQANLESLMQTLVAGGATRGIRRQVLLRQMRRETQSARGHRRRPGDCHVGIALVAPAEFILLNVKRTPDGVNVTEEVRRHAMRRPNDPVGNFRFVLELGFLQAAGFSECTGLQLETKVYEYREGGRNSHA